MKVVDIADEIFREVGEPSDMTIASVSFWVRTNMGTLNNYLNCSYVMNESTFEVEETKDGNTNTIGINEVAILKKMFKVHYYDIKIRETLGKATTDAVIELESDGSRIKKLNKIQQGTSYIRVKQYEMEELRRMITHYRLQATEPLQVAGDDTVAGVYTRTVDFNRVKYL